jgi:hypothetical protein
VPTYADADALLDYLAGNRGALRGLRRFGDNAIDKLLERAERIVDLALGPYDSRDIVSGLKLDLTTLTAIQRAAASRATCAVAEWILMLGPEFVAGDADYVSGNLSVTTPPAKFPPRLAQELAGTGLVRRSGTVRTVPEPPPRHPWAELEA